MLLDRFVLCLNVTSCFDLCLLSVALSLGTTEKSFIRSSILGKEVHEVHIHIVFIHIKIPLNLVLPRLNNPTSFNLSPCDRWETFTLNTYLCSPLQDLLQYVHISCNSESRTGHSTLAV